MENLCEIAELTTAAKEFSKKTHEFQEILKFLQGYHKVRMQ